MSSQWRPRVRPILKLGLPIVIALVAQNMMFLIMLAMIGRLGDVALAGVGVGTSLLTMFMAVLFGVDAGVQALVARHVGAGDTQAAGAVLSDALLLSVLAGLTLTVTAVLIGPSGIDMMVSDPAVRGAARGYLFAAAPGLLLMGSAFAFSAYWNASSAPAMSMRVVVIQFPINVALNYVLIFGEAGIPRLEVVGAGIASTVSAAVALAIHVLLMRTLRPERWQSLRTPNLAGIRTIIRIGSPVSIQRALFFLGSAFALAIVGRLGTAEVAAVSAMGGIQFLSTLPATGMGMAAAALVGQSLGRGDDVGAKSYGWEVGLISVLTVLPLSLIFLAFPSAILGAFIIDSKVVALAVAPMRLLALAMCIDSFGRILAFGLSGAGATKQAAGVSFLVQWLLQLPLYWFIGVHLGFGLIGIYGARLLLYVLETVVFVSIWNHGAWAHIRRRPEPRRANAAS